MEVFLNCPHNWPQHYSRHSSWKKKTQKGHSCSTAELCSPSAWWLPHHLHEQQFLWNLLTSPPQNYASVAPISDKSSLLRLKSSMSALGLILFQTFKLDWFNCFWARWEEKNMYCLVRKQTLSHFPQLKYSFATLTPIQRAGFCTSLLAWR